MLLLLVQGPYHTTERYLPSYLAVLTKLLSSAYQTSQQWHAKLLNGAYQKLSDAHHTIQRLVECSAVL